MIPTVVIISLVSFAIIQLPPGDYLTTLTAGLEAGEQVSQGQLHYLTERYGLDKPLHVQYWRWMSGIILRGDFGQSFEWNRPVKDLIWERIGLSFMLSLSTLLFVWAIAFPIGILVAVRQYSLWDYFWTFIGFIGLATPNFMLALILMYVAFRYFGQSVGGLFSPDFVDVPWSWARVLDMLKHLWIPIIVLGTSQTASLIRIMRANLLDELHKPYVTTARAKGMSEISLLAKYPVRVALNPFVSTVGWVLPRLVSGSVVTAVVLNLPISGPLMLRALKAQDMYLAGSFILLLSTLTIIGTLLSDILLAWLDPRIRYT
ncbi:MAG: ABC transporter permease [Anaerolineae bacterium CG2_30_64_16]|nr:MAG: ABC transporter permease [Anaerolineae bacterium CG2_30_64_16]